MGYHVVDEIYGKGYSHYGISDHDDVNGWWSSGKSGKGDKSRKGSGKSGKGSSKSSKGRGKSGKGGSRWSSETRDDDFAGNYHGGYGHSGYGKSGKGRRTREIRRPNLRASVTTRLYTSEEAN
jgi:hypothetical protein